MGRLIETVNKTLADQNFAFTAPVDYSNAVASYVRHQGITHVIAFQEFEDMQFCKW
jgi:hypothetical protein